MCRLAMRTVTSTWQRVAGRRAGADGAGEILEMGRHGDHAERVDGVLDLACGRGEGCHDGRGAGRHCGQGPEQAGGLHRGPRRLVCQWRAKLLRNPWPGRGAALRPLAGLEEPMSLKGRVAVVTGSTSGIGLGVAETLAAEGAALMLNGFGEAGQIAALRARLGGAYGVPVGHHPADMTKPGEIAALMADTVGEFGGLDILVNNAGIQHTALIEDFPAERWGRG